MEDIDEDEDELANSRYYLETQEFLRYARDVYPDEYTQAVADTDRNQEVFALIVRAAAARRGPAAVGRDADARDASAVAPGGRTLRAPFSTFIQIVGRSTTQYSASQE